MLKSSGSRHSMSRTCGPRDIIPLVIPRIGDNKPSIFVPPRCTKCTQFFRNSCLLLLSQFLCQNCCMAALKFMPSFPQKSTVLPPRFLCHFLLYDLKNSYCMTQVCCSFSLICTLYFFFCLGIHATFRKMFSLLQIDLTLSTFSKSLNNEDGGRLPNPSRLNEGM
jgi:hypothetical protein